MWSGVSVFTLLLSLGLALVMAASAASASTLAHSYILSLDAETPEATRKEVVESLKRQGAKVDLRLALLLSGSDYPADTALSSISTQILNEITYPGIMLAVSFEDTAAVSKQGSSNADPEAAIQAWRTSLASFEQQIVAIEQDQVVTTQPVEIGEPRDMEELREA